MNLEPLNDKTILLFAMTQYSNPQCGDIEEFHEDMEGVVTNHTDDTLDESPKAYKNIFEVMELQKDLVEIIDRSIPILNIKG